MNLLVRACLAAAALVSVLQMPGRSEQAAKTGAGRRPNVILVVTDQHRMASYPGEPFTSVAAPNLARLAAEGARFENAVSNYPVCSPYRALLLSGLAPFHSGVLDNSIRLRDTGQTLGAMFKKGGYDTAFIGKWHLGWEDHPLATPEDRPRAGTHGFDRFEVWLATNNHRQSRWWDPEKQVFVPYAGYNATGMTDHALEFIERRRDRPFLVVLCLNPPHSDFTDAPDEFQKMYEGVKLLDRPNVREILPQFVNPILRRVGRDGIHRGYLAHISAVDREMGRLLDALERSGKAGDTVVVYSSDHGEMLGSQGRMAKRQPWEESLRIPFVVRWKGHVKAGMRPRTLIGAVDFFPTLCGLAGLPVPAGLDGKDLSGALRGGDLVEPAYQPIMHIMGVAAGARSAPGRVNEYQEGETEFFRGVRTPRFMYAVTKDGPWLLYDLEQDAFQQSNRVADPAYRTELERLHDLTRRWLRAWDDPYVLAPLAPAKAGTEGSRP